MSDVELKQIKTEILCRKIVSVFCIANLFFSCSCKQMRDYTCNMLIMLTVPREVQCTNIKQNKWKITPN